MTISQKQILLVGMLLALMLGLGLFALNRLYHTNAAFESTYRDRVEPLAQLKIVADMYAVNIVDTVHKANHGALPHAEAIRLVRQAEQEIDRNWKAYTGTQLTPEEQQLIDQTLPVMQKAHAGIATLLKLLEASDAAGIDAGDEAAKLDVFARQDLYPAIEPVSVRISALVDLQLREAKKNYEQAHDDYVRTRALTWGLLLLALLAGSTFAAWLVLGMRRKINTLRHAMDEARDHQDLTLRVPVSGNDEIDRIATAYNELTEKIRELIRQVAGSVDTVHRETVQIAEASAQVAEATRLGAESTSSMAAAVEEVTVAITHVADSAHDAKEVSAHVRGQAENGSGKIQDAMREISAIDSAISQASDKVATLGADAARISSVVSVIKDVAEQTNLLALNAAIEAARAGEQGRGFAVVADEVRKLAERTAAATIDIQQMVSQIGTASQAAVSSIAATVQRTHDCTALADEAGSAIVVIRDDVQTAEHAVNGIADALAEQKSAVQLIAMQVEKVAQFTDENTEIAATMKQSAGVLSQLTTQLKQGVERFRF
ncbi:methyl-accepting chemotaxis protein [Chitinilyticum litopenaei]|uniref:methyl-accepting chemotaxis protein n=1 Tax=Chitinilyticum litopenaei TaxID=1121276 RepID=UPI00042899DF|nr:methyl-accepting chemotaxis protein [Chitinilyticum litopenaei]